MDQQEHKTNLFRQRRLFVALSLILFALHGLGIEVKSDVQLSLLTLTVKHPDLFPWVLWTCFFWAWWRYYTYEKSFRETESAQRRAELFRQNAFLIAEQCLRNAHARGTYEKHTKIGRDEQIDVSLADSEQLAPTEEGAYFRAITMQRSHNGKPEGSAFPITISLSTKDLATARMRSTFQYYADTHFWADYKAPYFLAILPFAGIALQTVRHLVKLLQ